MRGKKNRNKTYKNTTKIELHTVCVLKHYVNIITHGLANIQCIYLICIYFTFQLYTHTLAIIIHKKNLLFITIFEKN